MTQQIKSKVEEIKQAKGCLKVLVNTTYSDPRYFPIYNEAQEIFMNEIFRENKWSRFDRLILETLNSKADTLELLRETYSNLIDSLE